MLTTSIYVLAGSALGGLARYWLGIWSVQMLGPRLPWGTLLINVLGSLVIGWFGALTADAGRVAVSPDIRIFVMVGICGGFTTFSSFSLQTLDLLQQQEFGWAMAYIAASVALCLAAVTAGYALGR